MPTFVPNKSFGHLLHVSPKDLMLLETLNSEFSYIDVYFTDQSSKLLEIKDNLTIL